MRKFLRSLINKWGYDIVKNNQEGTRDGLPVDFSETDRKILQAVRPFTMTSPERIVALIQAVRYIESSNLEGSVVECGVWKGGSTMAAMLALKEFKDLNREIYLYDTFEGMSEPTEADLSFQSKAAIDLLNAQDRMVSDSVWCFSTLDEVKGNIASTQYPREKITFVKGKVEDTLPQTLPGKIAILRLDTDWYESTKHELEHLFPLLVKGGVLIIDDYGHWQGARKAVDEYFQNHRISILLNRIDYTGRIAIKS